MDELDLACEVCDNILMTIPVPVDSDLHVDNLVISGLYCGGCYQEHLADLADDPDDPPEDEDEDE